MAERGRPRGFDRAEALRKAMGLFWEHGYEGCSVSDLTKAMGINSPSLYAAFGCKEALFREAIALYSEEEGVPTERALREEPTARAAVEAMLRDNVYSYTDPDKPRGCMIVVAATTCTRKNEPVVRHLAELRRDGVTGLQQRLDRGVAEGDLPAGTNTAALAAFYVTLLHGLSIQARDGATRAELDATIDHAMAAWSALVPASG